MKKLERIVWKPSAVSVAPGTTTPHRLRRSRGCRTRGPTTSRPPHQQRQADVSMATPATQAALEGEDLKTAASCAASRGISPPLIANILVKTAKRIDW